MLASFYIQRQLSKALGLSVNAEEVFTGGRSGVGLRQYRYGTEP